MNLQSVIKNSNLSQSQKSFWEEKLRTASDFEKEAYLALFNNYPQDVKWMTESLIEADEALKGQDMEKYDKIQREIREKLIKILKS